MLVYFYHSKTAVVIFVDDRFNTGGFSRAAISVKENVIRALTVDKGKGVFGKKLFLKLVAHEIG